MPVAVTATCAAGLYYHPFADGSRRHLAAGNAKQFVVPGRDKLRPLEGATVPRRPTHSGEPLHEQTVAKCELYFIVIK